MTDSLQERLRKLADSLETGFGWHGVANLMHKAIMHQAADELDKLSRPTSVSEEIVVAAAKAVSEASDLILDGFNVDGSIHSAELHAKWRERAMRIARAALQAASVGGGDVAEQIEDGEVTFTPAHLKEIQRCVDQERERCAAVCIAVAATFERTSAKFSAVGARQCVTAIRAQKGGE